MTSSIGCRGTSPSHASLLLGAVLACAACNGAIGGHGSGPGTITGTGGSGNVDPGKVTASTTPFDAKTAFYATSKVKNLLTGLPVTDDDLTKVTTSGAAGLQALISTWM